MYEFLIIDFSVRDGNEIFEFKLPNAKLAQGFIKEITPIVNKYRKLIDEIKQKEEKELKQILSNIKG